MNQLILTHSNHPCIEQKNEKKKKEKGKLWAGCVGAAAAVHCDS